MRGRALCESKKLLRFVTEYPSAKPLQPAGRRNKQAVIGKPCWILPGRQTRIEPWIIEQWCPTKLVQLSRKDFWGEIAEKRNNVEPSFRPNFLPKRDKRGLMSTADGNITQQPVATHDHSRDGIIWVALRVITQADWTSTHDGIAHGFRGKSFVSELCSSVPYRLPSPGKQIIQGRTIQISCFTQPFKRVLLELDEPYHPETEIDREIRRRRRVHRSGPR